MWKSAVGILPIFILALLTNNKLMLTKIYHRIRCHISLLIVMSFFMGCNQINEEPNIVVSDNQEIDFTLYFPTRSVGNELETSILDPLNDYFTKDESVLLISQRTQNRSLSFKDEIDDGSKNDYLFKYVWDGTEAETSESGNLPNWGNGYNFKSSSGWGNPLTWTTVMNHGAYGNTYAFGALYYPKDNSEKSSVETDQSSLDNLKKSNILGTYHQTENLYERFRFRLYHLMACIRVTILVPYLKTDDVNGTTGFDERNIVANLLNLKKDFTIDWANLSSEERPVLKEDENITTTTNIKMYLQPVSGDRQNVVWNLSNFGMEGSDEVIEYTFTGLFPAQFISNSTNLLKFDIMQKNSTRNIETSYYWSSIQLSTSLQISSGTITNLVLYFPRGDNNAILLKSEILDWNHADTNVTITPETDQQNKS